MRRALCGAGLFSLAASLGATDYYLGSTAGQQAGVAVPDIAALNRLRLQPGDRVFFQAGEAFAGPIEITSEDAGRPDQPIVFTSYGTGRATIQAGDGSGVIITNAGGIVLRQLDLVGADKNRNTGSGIDAGAHLPDSTKLDYLRCEDLRISGFRFGVELWGWHSTDTVAWPGFRDVALSRLEVFDNLDEGIRVWGTWHPDGPGDRFSHEDLRITDCVVHHNHGDPAATTHTGSGIVVSGVDGALIERCVAHDNGGRGPARGGGPFGIWIFEANACTLQHNLVFNQRTSSTSDGGAFDLDGGTSNSVVQYNYSYHNDGPGIALIQYDGAAPLRGNVVRFNISENDSRAHEQGALYVGQFSAGRGIEGAEIFGNTLYVSANADGTRPPAVRIEDLPRTADLRLWNNLFIAAHDDALLAGAVAKPALAQFQGNAYWGGRFDLEAFRRGGQETLAGQPVGFRVDPELQAAGGGGAPTTPAELAELDAYRPRPSSPLARTGLDLAAQFNVDPGTRDFFGEPLVAGQLPVGAAALPTDSAGAIRLVNLSVRTLAGAGNETLIVGFVVGGRGAQSTLVRGIGPGLRHVGVTSPVVPDPQLTVFRNAAVLATNDNWSGTAQLRQRFSALGAFALTADSTDAALALDLGAGVYTAHLTSRTGANDLALVELYDGALTGAARFVNASARAQVGGGDEVLIAGFVLAGAGEKRLLVRGLGPSLVRQGVAATSVLTDPTLVLYRGGEAIATNDDWSGTAELRRAFATTGAASLAGATSHDAALLVSLPAGIYTAHLSGRDDASGVGLVEVFEVP